MNSKLFGDAINSYVDFKETEENTGVFYTKINPEVLNSVEFYETKDILSANTLNRPLLGLYEELEKNCFLTQIISKNLFGDRDTNALIVPDILEEFNKENVVIKKYSNNNKYALRIPSGALVVNKGKLIDDITNNETVIIVNAPKVNLFERQIADHLNIDLNEDGNNVRVNYFVKNGKLNYNLGYVRNVTTTISDAETSASTEVNTVDTIEFEGPTSGTLENSIDLVNAIYNITNLQYRKKSYSHYSLDEIFEFNDLSNGNYKVGYICGDYELTNITTNIISNSGKYILYKNENDSSIDNVIDIFSLAISKSNDNFQLTTESLLSKFDIRKTQIGGLVVRDYDERVSTGKNNYEWLLCNDGKISSSDFLKIQNRS